MQGDSNSPVPDATANPMSARGADTLGMDIEEMRRLGHKVVDMVIDRLAARDAEAAIVTGSPQQLREQLGGPLPELPLPGDESLALLADVALRYQQHGDHPRYFARVPGPSSFAAVLGNWLGVGFNTIAASWAGGSGPATVELVVIDWLREMLGMPADMEGVLVSGGSHASLTAITAVIARRGKGRVYLSDQTHACIVRALRVLGFGDDDVCVLHSDAHCRMPLAALESAIGEDRQAGRRPLMVVATAGTTNTGAVDPLEAIADLCAREALWLHVDGAYGAPAALTGAGRAYLQGMQRADSLVVDPHKWLFQPYDTGCLLIREGMLEPCFAMDAEYLRDVNAGRGEVDFRNRGLELTRRSRATKLWFSLRSYGVKRFREAIAYSIELAEYAESLLRGNSECWEVVSPAQIGIVCFALRGQPDSEHQRRARALAESGFACVGTTVLAGRSVLRLCIMNPLTTRSDIEATIERLARGA
jgi:aromatic-L-amino-acid decarboxylase